MVSLFVSRLFLGGIMSFYGYATFDIIYKKMKRNKEVHKNLVETAEKAINDLNRKDLKFIETSNKKLLFIFGIDNSIDDIDRISVLEQIFQNFTPNALFLERDINQ